MSNSVRNRLSARNRVSAVGCKGGFQREVELLILERWLDEEHCKLENVLTSIRKWSFFLYISGIYQWYIKNSSSLERVNKIYEINLWVSIEKDERVPENWREREPRKCSVLEPQEVGFKKQRTVSQVVFCLGLRKWEVMKGYWVWQFGNLWLLRIQLSGIVRIPDNSG